MINNKSKPLLETIKSRAIEIKIILTENQRLEIIDKLVTFLKLELVLDPKTSKLSPGNFVKFNYMCKEYNISPSNDLVDNLSKLLDLYKKNKNILFINLALFIVDHYFIFLKNKDLLNKDKIFDIKNYIFENLNSLIMYNINQNSFINAVNEKLKHG